MIDVAGIQRMLANLDPIGVANEAARLRKAATGIRETGENIDHTWTHALHPGVYEAPEGDLLRRAARPVREDTAEFAWGVWRVAGALESFAEAIRPIKARLESLLVDAHAFVLAAPADWREDEGQVAENNRLVAAVRDQAVALAAAEERCAADIYAAYGGREAAPARTGARPSAPPWGTAEEADLPWYEDVWNGVQSFGGGLWDVTWGGLSSLVFLQGADEAAAAWRGIGEWAAATAVVAVPGAQSLLVFDPVRDMVWNTHKGMVQGFLAVDEWRDDPARAGGMVLGNVLMLVGAKKAPSLAAGAGKAARAANTGVRAAAAAGRALDPLNQLAYAGAKTGHILKALKEQGVHLVRVPTDPIGLRPAVAGIPGNAVPGGPPGPGLAAKTKDLATSLSERAKNWLTLAEAKKPLGEDPAPHGRSDPQEGIPAKEGAGTRPPEGGTRATGEAAGFTKNGFRYYFGDDGRLYREGDPKGIYRDPETDRPRHVDDGEDVVRNEGGRKPRGADGRYVKDPLPKSKGYDFEMSMGPKRPYHPSPAAQVTIDFIRETRSHIVETRQRHLSAVKAEMGKYGIEKIHQINTREKIDEVLGAERLKIRRNPDLTRQEKVAMLQSVRELERNAHTYNALQAVLVSTTERMGMVAAKDFVVHKLKADLLTPLDSARGKADTLDVTGVLLRPDDATFIAVESKAGSASLEGRDVGDLKTAQQGSPEYYGFELRIDPDIKAALDGDPVLKARLQELLRSGNIEGEYYYVRTRHTGKVEWAKFVLTASGAGKYTVKDISGLDS
ncbi:hypothetical protein [Actinomadura sp. WAC 06369]|uniref:hypothetical protein n=1 Tax=Actinomadura sp. WAC 06369 TaxID=2203193 RepID=UPI000F79C7E0|nr:hypothetical protein [Actinomadura sp. WAC 06369]RSN52823.1 hypothetical protein DMH08_28115 [Actinomadura sp. WAC 06369]